MLELKAWNLRPGQAFRVRTVCTRVSLHPHGPDRAHPPDLLLFGVRAPRRVVRIGGFVSGSLVSRRPRSSRPGPGLIYPRAMHLEKKLIPYPSLVFAQLRDRASPADHSFLVPTLSVLIYV